MAEFIKLIDNKIDCPWKEDKVKITQCEGCIFCTGSQSSDISGKLDYWIKCRYREESKKKI